jgi:bacterioferritin
MDDDKRQEIVKLLQTSYNMELETVMNYLANSIWLDGIRAKHIKDSLTAEVQDEMMHAQQLAARIKVLEGRIPGSLELTMSQKSLQPPKDSLDVLEVIRGVIEAEQGAIDQYQRIIEATDQVDIVTQDLCIGLKGDEEEHRRLFKGYLAEAERMKLQ